MRMSIAIFTPRFVKSGTTQTPEVCSTRYRVILVNLVAAANAESDFLKGWIVEYLGPPKSGGTVPTSSHASNIHSNHAWCFTSYLLVDSHSQDGWKVGKGIETRNCEIEPPKNAMALEFDCLQMLSIFYYTPDSLQTRKTFRW